MLSLMYLQQDDGDLASSERVPHAGRQDESMAHRVHHHEGGLVKTLSIHVSGAMRNCRVEGLRLRVCDRGSSSIRSATVLDVVMHKSATRGRIRVQAVSPWGPFGWGFSCEELATASPRDGAPGRRARDAGYDSRGLLKHHARAMCILYVVAIIDMISRMYFA